MGKQLKKMISKLALIAAVVAANEIEEE